MENEIWKDVPNYEFQYQVSNLGRVKSLSRIGSRGCNIKEKILKAGISSNGYLSVSLYGDKSGKTYNVHQLMATAFLNHKACGYKLVVDHIDNNRRNNNLENLQIVTSRENSTKDRKNGASRYVGVRWYKRDCKWESRIKINKKDVYLGRFNSEIEAHNAYKLALSHLKNGDIDKIGVVKAVTSSKFKGVHFQKSSRKWIATININKKQKYIGSFKNENDAVIALKQFHVNSI